MTSAAVVICTRPESTRLPRKAFIDVAGVRAIEHILNRLIGSGLPVVLAVPMGCRDYDYLPYKYKNQLDLRVYYGNPQSPLHRMRDAIDSIDDIRDIDYVVRITHDDILIDRRTMDRLLSACDDGQYVYGWTPEIVEGAGVEVFRRDKLFHAANLRFDPTEFISYFVKSNEPERNLAMRPRPSICRPYRLTMDYAQDWLVLDIVLGHLDANAPLEKVVEFLDANPFIMNWNRLPTVSVYTCAFNAEKWIRETLRSVLECGNNDMEYLVLDDGSTDSTSMIVSEFSGDRRLRLIKNKKNKGLAACSNQAISEARGKYLMRVDADDKIAPNAIPSLLKVSQGANVGVVYPAFKKMDEHGKVTGGIQDPRENHHAGCAMMDKRLVNEIRFSDDLRHWDGLDLYQRIKDRFSIGYVNEPLWFYRQHPKSLSKSNDPARAAARNQIMSSSHPLQYSTTVAYL